MSIRIVQSILVLEFYYYWTEPTIYFDNVHLYWSIFSLLYRAHLCLLHITCASQGISLKALNQFHQILFQNIPGYCYIFLPFFSFRFIPWSILITVGAKINNRASNFMWKEGHSSHNDKGFFVGWAVLFCFLTSRINHNTLLLKTLLSFSFSRLQSLISVLNSGSPFCTYTNLACIYLSAPSVLTTIYHWQVYLSLLFSSLSLSLSLPLSLPRPPSPLFSLLYL